MGSYLGLGFCPRLYSTRILFLSQVGRARFRAPELLFHPVLIGEESEGIHQVRTVVYYILEHKHALDFPLQHNMHDFAKNVFYY